MSISFSTRTSSTKIWNPRSQIYDYIFISHEHFDHCHPPTLLKLCQGDRFKKLFVSPGCVYPVLPIDVNYGDAAFERDLPITKYLPAEKVQVLYPKHLDDSQADVREFPGPFEADLGALKVETVESGENSDPCTPTCGYLVSHVEKNISVLHTGDMHSPYPALKNIQGRIDFLIHMKLGLTEWEGPNSYAESCLTVSTSYSPATSFRRITGRTAPVIQFRTALGPQTSPMCWHLSSGFARRQGIEPQCFPSRLEFNTRWKCRQRKSSGNGTGSTRGRCRHGVKGKSILLSFSRRNRVVIVEPFTLASRSTDYAMVFSH